MISRETLFKIQYLWSTQSRHGLSIHRISGNHANWGCFQTILHPNLNSLTVLFQVNIFVVCIHIQDVLELAPDAGLDGCTELEDLSTITYNPMQQLTLSNLSQVELLF